jgi:hypothetical protein
VEDNFRSGLIVTCGVKVVPNQSNALLSAPAGQSIEVIAVWHAAGEEPGSCRNRLLAVTPDGCSFKQVSSTNTREQAMATIVLRPGETFEHYHCAPSQTIHVSGDVEFRIEGISRVMRSGESILGCGECQTFGEEYRPGSRRNNLRGLRSRQEPRRLIGSSRRW